MFEVQTRGLVLELTMSRAPANAVNREWIEAFEAILDDLARQPDIPVLLIRSSLRIFSAGADLKLMRDCFAAEDGPGRMIETVRRMQRLFDRIEALPQVVVARSVARRTAADLNWRSPVICVSRPKAPGSVCRRPALVCCRARGARSGCRASPVRAWPADLF